MRLIGGQRRGVKGGKGGAALRGPPVGKLAGGVDIWACMKVIRGAKTACRKPRRPRLR
jgi:hypothetical protein